MDLLFRLQGDPRRCFSLVLKPKEDGSKRTTVMLAEYLQTEETGL